MRIRTKITLFISVLILVSLFFVFGQYVLEQERIQLFLNGIKDEEKQSFDRLINLSGSELAIFASDYSYWDEMVKYVHNPDPVFAKENIEVSVFTFHASEAYVYTDKGKLVYAYDKEHPAVPPVFSEDLFKQFLENRLTHFFTEKNGALTEFRLATIHPTGSPDRKTEPQGLFVVGKRWDADYLATLKELTGKTIIPKKEIMPILDVANITFSHEFKDWNNEVVEKFTVISALPIVSDVQQTSQRQILIIIGSSLLILFFVYIFLRVLVGRPIEALSQGIKKKDIALMKSMQKSHSEFGTLAKLVLDFSAYEQREVFERSKRDFISIVSHELRTPLTSLRWAVEKLEAHKDIPLDVLTSTIPYIKSALERIKTLVAAMVDVSKIESGSIIAASTSVKVSSLIARSVDSLKPAIETKNLKVTVNEETNGGDSIQSDERLLQIIINNLISNAVRYSNENGEVRVAVRKDGPELAVSIGNSGPGIPLEEQAQIFTKLFRATNAKLLSPDGAGLGLYISKSFLETLGGRVSFSSVPDKETIFTIHLPFSS